jgi:hypothetical protein
LSSWFVRFDSWRLPELASLGWCHNCCGVNQSEKTIQRCGQMSDHHFRANLERLSIKYPWNVVYWAAFQAEWKKMNSNQNDAVLVKINLILRFLIFMNYIPDWPKTSNFT